MKPDLLGYLLKSLDREEEHQVEEYLESTPSARRELVQLRRHLNLLEAWGPCVPPDDLLYKTLRSAAAERSQIIPAGKARPVPAKLELQPWTLSEAVPPFGTWRRPDIWISIAMLVLVCLAVPPALHYVRERSLQVECRNNMRMMHPAFLAYLDNNQGFIPAVPKDVSWGVAGVYAPLLREAGLWGEDLRLHCGREKNVQPVSLNEVRQHDPNDYGWWTKLGGSYGYHLGYLVQDGSGTQVVAIRRGDGDGLPILADRPPRLGEVTNHQTANSPNHGGRGQNVLFFGGHVLFQVGRMPALGEDRDIYRNQRGQQAAGLNVNDVVIGPSEARPIANAND